MRDEQLDRLCLELRPVRQDVVGRRLALAAVAGGAVALAEVASVLGVRPDLVAAMTSGMLWAKLCYGGSLAGLGLWALERLARPGGSAGRRLGWGVLPIVLLGGAALVQLGLAEPGTRIQLIRGVSAKICPWLILATATPLLVAMGWALRRLAPTRLRLAGGAAGLAAGGLAACVYTLHCPESGLAFVALWYSLGIALSCGAGVLLGPLALRW